MKQLDIDEAKTRFSDLIDQVGRGDSFIIAKSGTPIAKLVPLALPERPQVRFGLMKGEIELTDDFDDPLPPDVLRAFEGDT